MSIDPRNERQLQIVAMPGVHQLPCALHQTQSQHPHFDKLPHSEHVYHTHPSEKTPGRSPGNEILLRDGQ